MSRAKLARRLEVGRSGVNWLPLGEGGITIQRPALLAHALGMSRHVSFQKPVAGKPMPVNPDQHAAAMRERER